MEKHFLKNNLMSFGISGSFGGGASLTIQGSGFSPLYSNVTICDQECEVDRNTSTSSELHCMSPVNNSEFGPLYLMCHNGTSQEDQEYFTLVIIL